MRLKHERAAGTRAAKAFIGEKVDPWSIYVRADTVDELAASLTLISSEVRLRILQALREPTRLSAIRVTAGLSREGERPERPLSRQTVAHHVEQLVDAGLVRRALVGGDRRGDAYVVNHESLFALLDNLRRLNSLRPYELDGADPDATVAAREPSQPRLPERPRLVEAYGARDGQCHVLPATGRVTIGRSSVCDVHLDHDPYVSATHCELRRDDDAARVVDLASSNGTWVNLAPARPRAEIPLVAGDLLRVGRTVLVYQP